MLEKPSKLAHYIVRKKIDAAHYKVEFDTSYKSSHGVPKTIVSNRDVKFQSQFQLFLWKKLDTTLKFNSTCHPQTDEQTEVTNRTLDNMLTCIWWREA